MSRPARAASASVTGLQKSLTTAKKELAGFQAQLALAKNIGDIEGYRRYSAAVDGARRNVFELGKQVEGLGPASAAAETLGKAFGRLQASPPSPSEQS